MADKHERARKKILIDRSHDLHSGQLVFAGTRVPVGGLIEFLQHGRTTKEFLEAFPTVESWQVEMFLDACPDAVEHLTQGDCSYTG